MRLIYRLIATMLAPFLRKFVWSRIQPDQALRLRPLRLESLWDGLLEVRT